MTFPGAHDPWPMTLFTEATEEKDRAAWSPRSAHGEALVHGIFIFVYLFFFTCFSIFPIFLHFFLHCFFFCFFHFLFFMCFFIFFHFLNLLSFFLFFFIFSKFPGKFIKFMQTTGTFIWNIRKMWDLNFA